MSRVPPVRQWPFGLSTACAWCSCVMMRFMPTTPRLCQYFRRFAASAIARYVCRPSISETCTAHAMLLRSKYQALTPPSVRLSLLSVSQLLFSLLPCALLFSSFQRASPTETQSACNLNSTVTQLESSTSWDGRYFREYIYTSECAGVIITMKVLSYNQMSMAPFCILL